MAIRREKLQLFSMSFLDVISCGFGAVLLAFLLVSSQAQENAKAAMEKRTVAFTIQMWAEDPNGELSADFTAEGRVSLIFPPNAEMELGDDPPDDWIHSTSDLSKLCLNHNVTPPGQTLYAVFRGVNPKRFIVRIVPKVPPRKGKKIFARGWVTDPTRGYRELSDCLLPSSVNVIDLDGKIEVSDDFRVEFDCVVAE